jgi:hypothetical protein
MRRDTHRQRRKIIKVTGHSGASANSQRTQGRKEHSEAMSVVTQLLAAVGTLTAVVLILLMAAVPLLLDLPLRRPKGR